MKLHYAWSSDPRIPEYINTLEDAQKKALRAKLPITDAWLVAIASRSLTIARSFPKERPEWDGLTSTAKTWSGWKTAFTAAHFALERSQRVAGDTGGSNSFGTANGVIRIHGITKGDRPNSHNNNTAPDPTEFAAQFDAAMDNLAGAVTNEGTTIKIFANTIAKLTETNATLAASTKTTQAAPPHLPAPPPPTLR